MKPLPRAYLPRAAATDLPRQNTLAVDVDGTLIRNDGTLNAAVVDHVEARRDEGFTLILWSARGQAHAQMQADQHGVAHLFDHILSKPGYVIDDHAWDWTRFTDCRHPDRLV